MNLAPLLPRLGWSLGPAVAVFGVLVVVSVIEAANGNWPGAHLSDSSFLTFDEVLSGAAAKGIEKDLVDNSVVAETLRPYYAEGLYHLFRRINPDYILGKEDWLFYANTIPEENRAEGERILTLYAGRIARIAQRLDDLGCRLVVAVVPNKAEIHEDKLPDRVELPFITDQLVVPMLQSHGVAVFDVRAAISGAPTPQYSPSDSHWSMVTAHHVWGELAEFVASIIGLPDDELASGPLPMGPPGQGLSGMARNLGFREQSLAADRFQLRRRPSKIPAPQVPQTGAPYVCVGTSFSDRFQQPEALSLLMGRVFEDRCVRAELPHTALEKVCCEIIQGARMMPELIVWEFPSRYFFTIKGPFLDGLEDIDKDLTSFVQTKLIPLQTKKVKLVSFQECVQLGADGYRGISPGGQAKMFLHLSEDLSGDGSCSLVLDIEIAELEGTASCGLAVVGEDAPDFASMSRTPVKKGLNHVELAIRLGNGGSVRQLILIPISKAGRFKISGMRLRVPK